MVTTRQEASQSVTGACVLRDCVDIVPFLCGHYLRMGFAHLAFVDDGSTDGTYELLQRIAKRAQSVSVKQVHIEDFEQPALMTEAVNGLVAAGHSIIVPFDSDEFWDVDGATLRSILAPMTEAVVEGHWVNFVQRKSRLHSTRLGLFSATHRAPHLPDAGQETITTYTNSFLCFSIQKIAIKTAKPVKIGRGQHVLAVGPQEVCGTKLEILHLPFRSRAEILKRGLNYEPRRATVRKDRGMSWQSKFFGEAATNGKLDAVWAAHSCDSSGQIDIYGKPLATAEDYRLRRTLVRAGWHFLTRTGLNPLWWMVTLKAPHRLAERRTALVAAAQPLATPAGAEPTPLVPEEAPAFDSSWYLAAYPDVAEAGIDPYEHYKVYGKGEGRHPTATAAEEALGFDRAWYLGAYPDVATSGQDPFRHWLDHGKAEGRHFNAHFSFSPRQLALLAKSYHYKDHEAAPSPELATRAPLPTQPTPTFDSAQYWRDRYRSGGNSGAGSYGRLADFKAEIVNAFVREHDVASVIEFGSGDGAQLALADYPTYLGFDVADESVELCRSKFAKDSSKEFRNSATWDYERADLTLSLDVIFHLIEDDVFHDYMRRLFFSAKRYVIVYSSNHEGEHIAAHVKHRRFTDWVDIYHADFKLVRHAPNPYPLTVDDQTESFADFFIFERQPSRKHTLPGHLVVSLTSYPRRFPTLELTLRRILQQSVQPDETVLWISTEDRQHLPEGVLALQRSGLTVRETRDIRSYKKIIPTLEHYPDSFIITLDDDMVYPHDTIEPLVVQYRSPTEILCRRAHKIIYDAVGKPLPYNRWQLETPDESGPDLFPTGGAGALYPPHTLASEVLEEPTFTALAPMADDVWLFWMGRRAGSTIRQVGSRYALVPWPGCHEQGLWVNENANGGNDRVITALTARYGSPFGQGLVHVSNVGGGDVSRLTLESAVQALSSVERRCQKSTLAKYPVIEPGGQLKTETVIVNTRHGFPLVITPKNRWIDQNLWKNGSYELGTTHLIRKFLGSGETFFDIGANIGLMTIAASLTVGPTGRVVSFEPDYTNVCALLENILLNKATNVCVLNLAVGDSVGEFSLFRSATNDGGLTSLVKKRDFQETQVVSTMPLDKMLDMFPGRRVSLVKIDVEGYEHRVIKGAQEFLSHYKPIVIMEFEESHGDGQYNCLDAGAILLSLGYNGYFGNGKGVMDTVLRFQPTLESKKHDNMIFIHRDRRAHAQRYGIELS